MVIKRKCLPPNVLEMICNILGDTNHGFDWDRNTSFPY